MWLFRFIFLILLTISTAVDHKDCEDRRALGFGLGRTTCASNFIHGGYYSDSRNCVFLSRKETSNYVESEEECKTCQGRLLNINENTKNLNQSFLQFFSPSVQTNELILTGARIIPINNISFGFEMATWDGQYSGMKNLLDGMENVTKQMVGQYLLLEYNKTDSTITQIFESQENVTGYFCEFELCLPYSYPGHKSLQPDDTKISLVGDQITVVCANANYSAAGRAIQVVYRCSRGSQWKKDGGYTALECFNKSENSSTSTSTDTTTAYENETGATENVSMPLWSISEANATLTPNPSTWKFSKIAIVTGFSIFGVSLLMIFVWCACRTCKNNKAKKSKYHVIISQRGAAPKASSAYVTLEQNYDDFQMDPEPMENMILVDRMQVGLGPTDVIEYDAEDDKLTGSRRGSTSRNRKESRSSTNSTTSSKSAKKR